MNTTQTTNPPAPPPTQNTLFPTLLTDLDDPRLSELDLCRRHALTPEQLVEAVRRPGFRRALAHLREVRDIRRPHMLARAESEAARILESLAARETPTPAAAKEARLACKDHLRLRGVPPASPPGHAHDESSNRGVPGAADLHSPSRAHPEPPAPETPPMQSADSSSPSITASPALGGEVARRSRDGGGLGTAIEPNMHPSPSGGVGAAAPTQQLIPNEPPRRTPRTPTPSPRKPKYPRGTKPRPKPRSR